MLLITHSLKSNYLSEDSMIHNDHLNYTRFNVDLNNGKMATQPTSVLTVIGIMDPKFMC